MAIQFPSASQFPEYKPMNAMTPLLAAAQYGQMDAQTQLAKQKMAQEQADLAAMAKYAETQGRPELSGMSPEIGARLMQAEAMKAHYADANKAAAEQEKRHHVVTALAIAKENPDEGLKYYNAGVEKFGLPPLASLKSLGKMKYEALTQEDENGNQYRSVFGWNEETGDVDVDGGLVKRGKVSLKPATPEEKAKRMKANVEIDAMMDKDVDPTAFFVATGKELPTGAAPKVSDVSTVLKNTLAKYGEKEQALFDFAAGLEVGKGGVTSLADFQKKQKNAYQKLQEIANNDKDPMSAEAKADLPKVQQMFKIMEDSIGLQAPAAGKATGAKGGTGAPRYTRYAVNPTTNERQRFNATTNQWEKY